MFIFNENLLRVRRKRFLYHYCPLFLAIAYPTFLYLGLVVIHPCDGTQWDYASILCGLSNCYLENSYLLAILDWALDNGVRLLVILVLILRVVYKKRRLQQSVS
ncbi:unnamed protein product [Adineta ricciae]|uniref:Uncharacterized protein n=1 Tax=Adineta ricciae TaxID=249248 RepID=A0A814X0Y8_ADIRI|nr:unnamed protein product [Adineta ricciae]CAF1540487.1 unnamed protein product [Adineta ricciae]